MGLPIKHGLKFFNERGATGTMGDPWGEVTCGEGGLGQQDGCLINVANIALLVYAFTFSILSDFHFLKVLHQRLYF